ncbi:MAG: hypothetical protein A2V60_00165 [Candidatus Portnoybacteria bacterium RIFCSPHIGHO2_01_FULL_39_19]|nr:MAG: hypothetical protein A2V60_00165 [Candidatus Portnoybacteria bacterium RIFCSPHIGHO2_01_FULL_39_19]
MDNQEQKVFSSFYQGNVEKIYRFIYYKTHHKETAEDLTSQTFFKALESMRNFDSHKGNFSSWLYSIAKNTVIDFYRTKRSETDISDIWDLAGKEDIERDSEYKEQLEKAEKYLKDLKPEQREIILMRVWGDLPYKEIAGIIGKSEANCKMIFSRAINKLRKEEVFVLIVLLTLIKI